MIENIPEIAIPKTVSLPEVETVTLPNGLSVHIIQSPGQDVVRVSLVWAAGSAVQTIAGYRPFTASATLNLLAEGSRHLTSHEIAERLDFVGSYYDVNIDRDYALVTFCCLEKFTRPTLDVMGEILLRPAFPPDEIELYARKRMERLTLERSKPATKAREMFSQALFGDGHPYGISSPESEYMNLTREDVENYHCRFYAADNCFVVCSLGDDAALREAVLELLAQIPSSSRDEDEKMTEIAFPEPLGTRRRTLSITDAVQSAIRIGRVLFPREHPDFVGMQVVATILGGYFGSRLTVNLREERGYTYGVMAAMVNLREAGYLAIATEVAAEATDDAVMQIFAEMERLKTEPVSEDELDTVRRSMLGEVMRILDGPFGIVDVVIENIQICGPRSSTRTNYLSEFIREIEHITPQRIMSLARKYLDRDSFTTVIVGKE